MTILSLLFVIYMLFTCVYVTESCLDVLSCIQRDTLSKMTMTRLNISFMKNRYDFLLVRETPANTYLKECEFIHTTAGCCPLTKQTKSHGLCMHFVFDKKLIHFNDSVSCHLHPLNVFLSDILNLCIYEPSVVILFVCNQY